MGHIPFMENCGTVSPLLLNFFLSFSFFCTVVGVACWQRTVGGTYYTSSFNDRPVWWS